MNCSNLFYTKEFESSEKALEVLNLINNAIINNKTRITISEETKITTD